MKKSLFMLVAILAAVVSLNGIVAAGDDIPAEITAAFQKLAGDAKVDIEAEEEDGETYYEGEWEVKGREHEAIVDANGKVLFEEAEVGEDAVPEVVRSAAKRHLGEDAVIEYDRIVIHGDEGSETFFDAEGAGKEVTLKANGELIEDDDDDDEDDDEDDDDEDDDEDDDDE